MIEQGPDIDGNEWRRALRDVFNAKNARQEEAIRLILTGQAKLSDWPETDTQLAQCKTCKGFTILQLIGHSLTHPRFGQDILDSVYAYDWQCDACDGAAE